MTAETDRGTDTGRRPAPTDEIVEPLDHRAAPPAAGGRPAGVRARGHRVLRMLLPIAGSLVSTATAATVLYAGIDLTPLDRSQPTLAPPRTSTPGTPPPSFRPPATSTPSSPVPDPPDDDSDRPRKRRGSEWKREHEDGDALLLLRMSVQNGVEAREIRPDVGLDLTNLIDAAIREARAGIERSVDARIEQLRATVVTRVRERTITPWRASRLQRLIDDADAQH
ncbi:hypothetical protein Arub01_00120 [Actinomadura rubrobrunea]|uniref:Uncharacterized protein n=1 Tax=Actinomadura rubrobrunea TaxID=115335 RepID=A0A9W6PRJ6_9ACTN|nr:hypothetical protein [Actinomadura rubrobrunea]GLW61768.1 hypothetical protein Arub01_00120 [Actinomadura rubrobrunea]